MTCCVAPSNRSSLGCYSPRSAWDTYGLTFGSTGTRGPRPPLQMPHPAAWGHRGTGREGPNSEPQGPMPHSSNTTRKTDRLCHSEVVVTVVEARRWTRCPQGPFQAYVAMTFALHRDTGADVPWAAQTAGSQACFFHHTQIFTEPNRVRAPALTEPTVLSRQRQDRRSRGGSDPRERVCQGWRGGSDGVPGRQAGQGDHLLPQRVRSQG